MNSIKLNLAMRKSRVHLLTLGLFILVSCGAEKSNPSDEGFPKGNNSAVVNESKKVQSVEVVNPQKRTFSGQTLISGKAMPNQMVMVYAMESGYVKRIKKNIGDVVRKGEVIAELDNPGLRGMYEQKDALLTAKKSIYDRLQATYEKTPAITPMHLVDDAKGEYFSLKAEVDAILKRISFLQVRAPFSGIITKRSVDNGAMVQSGFTENKPQAIVELQEVDPIRLTIPLPESDIASVSKGTEVSVSFPELPGANFNASISRTAGALDPASKTMQVEIDLSNPEGIIKPGMYAEVVLETSSRTGVISLPITAQSIFENQTCVFVVKGGVVERIGIRKGLSNKDYFEVLNSEITEKSQIIVQGKGLVKPGQQVNPVLKSN